MLSETVTADSVVIHDSVYVREAGDTVIMTRWLTRWRERTVHDTVRSHSTDTVVMTETVEKTVEVPKKGGNAGWIVAMAIMAAAVLKMYLKTR